MKKAARAVRGESRVCVMNEMCDGYDRGETDVVGNARTRARARGGARDGARETARRKNGCARERKNHQGMASPL